MNELQIFNNSEFGQIRTFEEDGKVLFCATDVARALGYAKPQDAVSRHCRYSVKRGVPHPQAQNKMIEMLFIPDGDVYRLIAHSKLPAAEKFERWLFDEVAPQAAKYGVYMTPARIQEVLADPNTLFQWATILKEEQEKNRALTQTVSNQQKQIAADKPKVLFADAVSTSKSSILVGDLAKLIRQNGVNMGQNRLFSWLRDNQFLCAKGERYNMPTQRSMDMGLFEVKETTIANPDGSIRVNRTTKVTGKGQQYFINRFLGDGQA